MDEKAYIKLFADEARDTVDMFSSRRKREREQRACAAFLRCLGISFNPGELTLPKDGPPDVIFHDANFEVTMALDEGRKIHAELKAVSKRRNEAKSMDDLIDSYKHSIPISMDELLHYLTDKLMEKVSHYGPKERLNLDALLHINLENRHLYPLPVGDFSMRTLSQGWRSVSFLFPPYAYVVAALENAPDFLYKKKCCVRRECKNPDVMYDL